MLSVTAALLIVVGAVVVVTAPAPQSFGWFAYAPLSGDAYVSPDRFSLPVLIGGRQLLGAAAVVTGLVLAGLVVGFRIGRRSIR